MEATHSIWRTPVARTAAAAGDFGILLRMSRTAQNLTLAQAGKRCGYSASTMSRLETGRQPLTDVTLLRHFAEVFSIPLGLFGLAPPRAESSPTGAASTSSTGQDATVCGKTAREGGEDPVRRRRALTGLVGITGATLLGIPDHAGAQDDSVLVPSAPTAVAVHLFVRELRATLAVARSLFQRCRYADLADTLPELIRTTQLSRDETDGHQHEELSALLADAYSLASELCIRLHDYPLAWVTADRARSAAHASGNAASVAEAARMASIAMRKHGHHDAAITLLSTTALKLSATTGSPQPDLLGTYGSLLCTAAYTAAQHGSRGHALELIGEAEDAARHLDQTTTSHSTFSATNVTIYQIGVRTALGDAGTALDYARRVEIRSLPTAERQARFCVDTARAWHRFGDLRKCYQALQAAEHVAPEELRRPSVRSLVTTLLRAPGPVPAELRALAARIQASA
ncbi:MAG: helix-turn-helix domain-containing protein [Pseudonocardiaceae bacterium]